jgi:ATP-dependent exoDNAse (exonuclease V) alpha subunit
VGDRVQLTAPARELKVANRELGTIVSIGADTDKAGKIALKMNGGREVTLDSAKQPRLDHGYAVTSHSSQGQTAERVLVHVDTELSAKDLLTAAWPMSPSRAEPTTLKSSPTTAESSPMPSVAMSPT